MTHSETPGSPQDRIVFFDTTLRDGEQSPGCSMSTAEKIEMAHALDDLGVDILEAGFAISSEGDFQAIRAVSQAVRRPVDCISCSRTDAGRGTRCTFARPCGTSPHSHLPRQFRPAS